MRYVSTNKPFDVTVEEMEMPTPREGEALLRIRYAGICGSDLNTYRGTFIYASYPRIPGHEFSAEVVDVGANEHGLDPGMLVTGNPYYNCGKCYSCTRGFVNCCTSNQTLGAQRDGIFREYFTMPVDRIYPGHGLDAQTLALIEPFCISYHGVHRAGVSRGEKVLVVGAGPIGLFALKAAKLKGAHVTVTDIAASRLEKAKVEGADEVINSASENLEAACHRVTDGNGFDAAIECAGRASTFLDCMRAVAFRGRVAVIGIGKENLDFAYAQIQTKELDIFGSRNALKSDFTDLIAHVEQEDIDLNSIVTRVASLEEAPDAMREAAERPDRVIKTLIEFNR